jgi:L-rhamnose mutarotase
MTTHNLKQGYPAKQFGQPTKRYCQQLDLVDDAALIEQYKYWHAPANNWQEIAAGIRSVGILEMEIYLHKNHAFMIVEVPADFDWDSAFAKLATLDRQAEWEAFVAKFQCSKPGATSDEKWQLMERIYALTECK